MTRLGRVGSRNTCIHSNCRVDSDCASGYCSPSVSPECGPFYGILGYYCHSCDDTCTNDSECVQTGSNGQPVKGYCAYQPTVGHWACGFGFCAG
jgi:hypothetical protein